MHGYYTHVNLGTYETGIAANYDARIRSWEVLGGPEQVLGGPEQVLSRSWEAASNADCVYYNDINNSKYMHRNVNLLKPEFACGYSPGQVPPPAACHAADGCRKLAIAAGTSSPSHHSLLCPLQNHKFED